MTQNAVNDFPIDPISKSVAGSTGRPEATSASPNPAVNRVRSGSVIATAMPGVVPSASASSTAARTAATTGPGSRAPSLGTIFAREDDHAVRPHRDETALVAAVQRRAVGVEIERVVAPEVGGVGGRRRS